MRIWSLHPQYLDAKGLVALWRETLLAKHVLEGKTKGYKNHPQLQRFKEMAEPVAAIHQYLAIILAEAGNRNYRFDASKCEEPAQPQLVKVTTGQLAYEVAHLMNKLQQRDPAKHLLVKDISDWQLHPMFTLEEGPVAAWEIITTETVKKKAPEPLQELATKQKRKPR